MQAAARRRNRKKGRKKMLQAPAKLRLRVSAAQKIAEDIVQFDLVAEDQSDLTSYAAGAHVDVYTPTGLIRQYSLCGDPADHSRYRIAVKLEPQSRGGSKWMHDDLKLDGSVLVSQPRNNFLLSKTADPVILMAGGIGITPLISMAYALSAEGRLWKLHYFVRSEAHAAFRHLLASRTFAEHVEFHVGLDVAATLDTIQRLVSVQPTDAQLYICGPEPFMNAVTGVAAGTWSNGSVHLEHFVANPDLDVTGEEFEVVLARSGESLMVGPDQTIIEALAASGYPIETSCEQGVCGTCVTKVLSGAPDHRDMFLTDEEKSSGKLMTPCVSRARGHQIVLDL
jgi:vanillate O-demethylase ferredoxin subunit